jgi:hypothetical protein
VGSPRKKKKRRTQVNGFGACINAFCSPAVSSAVQCEPSGRVSEKQSTTETGARSIVSAACTALVFQRMSMSVWVGREAKVEAVLRF